MVFIQVTSLAHAFWIENAIFMRAISCKGGPSVLSVAGWAHILCIVLSVWMWTICVPHNNFRLKTDQVRQIYWWFNFFALYLPIDCLNIDIVGNRMGSTDIALFTPWGRAWVRFFSLLSTTGKLRLLFFTVDAGLDLLTHRTFNNFFTTTHFFCLLTAKR